MTVTTSFKKQFSPMNWILICLKSRKSSNSNFIHVVNFSVSSTCSIAEELYLRVLEGTVKILFKVLEAITMWTVMK